LEYLPLALAAKKSAQELWSIVITEVPADIYENCGDAYTIENTTGTLLAIAADARRTSTAVLVRAFPAAGQAAD
jgi:hypothetical protein